MNKIEAGTKWCWKHRPDVVVTVESSRLGYVVYSTDNDLIGVSTRTFRENFMPVETEQAKELRELRAENARLVAELTQLRTVMGHVTGIMVEALNG